MDNKYHKVCWGYMIWHLITWVDQKCHQNIKRYTDLDTAVRITSCFWVSCHVTTKWLLACCLRLTLIWGFSDINNILEFFFNKHYSIKKNYKRFYKIDMKILYFTSLQSLYIFIFIQKCVFYIQFLFVKCVYIQFLFVKMCLHTIFNTTHLKCLLALTATELLHRFNFFRKPI